jgi:putative transposase
VLFDDPPESRRGIYTTHAMESLHCSLRQRRKTRGAFPSDEAMVTVVYLARQHMAKRWPRPMRDGKAALNQFVILCGERGPK